MLAAIVDETQRETVGQGIEHAFNGPIEATADAHDVARSTAARLSRATASALIHIRFDRRCMCGRVSLTSWNSKYVKPGQSAQTLIAWRRFSTANACENLIRYAFDAA